MASTTPPDVVSAIAVPTPFPISLVAGRHLIYDVNAATYVRRVHHITGVLIGCLPHIPQQNTFSGLPLELMPEEARLLVEQGHAYVVDDVQAHRSLFLGAGMAEEERRALVRGLEARGREAARASQREAEERKEVALKKVALRRGAGRRKEGDDVDGEAKDGEDVDDTASLFSAPSHAGSPAPMYEDRWFITPTTSYDRPPSPPPSPQPSGADDKADRTLLAAPAPRRPSPPLPLPAVPPSYPLFAYLHGQGFFIMPGLRFGCQYMAYPGDPMGFHSHFLAVGKGWDEEVALLDIVGGGRLGTGVKKGFLLGGVEEGSVRAGKEEGNDGTSRVRTFCFEWAGM